MPAAVAAVAAVAADSADAAVAAALLFSLWLLLVSFAVAAVFWCWHVAFGWAGIPC